MPERQKEVFPQPLHFGVNLLTDEQSFKLPEHYFDVAEDARAKLEAKKFKKPPSYTFIRTNQYTSRPKLPGEVPVCFCDPDDNCGDNCMNRLMQFICNPKHCPCGEKCTNGSLGKRPTAKLDVQHVSICALELAQKRVECPFRLLCLLILYTQFFFLTFCLVWSSWIRTQDSSTSQERSIHY